MGADYTQQQDNQEREQYEAIASTKGTINMSYALIAKALAAAQGELENAAKRSSNEFFNSKYADLAEVLNTVRPVMSRHGIAIVQMPTMTGGTVSVETMLVHSSGQYITCETSAQPKSTSPQDIGSTITYLRRYALAAMCGIAQADDDGNSASGRYVESNPAKKPAPSKPSAAEVNDAETALKNASTLADLRRVYTSFPIVLREATLELSMKRADELKAIEDDVKTEAPDESQQPDPDPAADTGSTAKPRKPQVTK